MQRFVVSQTDPRAFPSITHAAKAPATPGGVRHILVEPGHYRSDPLRYWGTAVITAVGGPGSVTVDCTGDYTLRVEGHVTVQGLVLRNWNDEGNVLEVQGGTAVAEHCEIVGKSTRAVSAWGASELFLRNTRVDVGGVVFSDSAGMVENSEVRDARLCGIAVRGGSRVTIRSTRVQDAGEHGIWVTEGSTPLIEDCVVEGSAGGNILVQHRAEANVTGCTLTRSGKSSLVVRDRGTVTARGCRIAGSGLEGMWATADARLDASGIRIEDSRRHGVLVDERAEARLHNCAISGSASRGLVAAADATVRIEDVRSRDNGEEDLVDRPAAGAGDQVKENTTAPAPAAAAAEKTSEDAEAAPAPGGETSALDELEAMIGLAGVKREIRKLVSLQKVAEQRRRAGLPPGPAIGRHMVFAGPPGTGKTTVARLYGRILAGLGAVSEGQLVEVSRADLVSENVGGTARRTSEAFRRAMGGVLFVDEAYALAREATGTDFGKEAIDTLVKLMEDHRDQVVVVLAGYSAEMRDFLSANPGLRSRVSRTIEFEHYGPEELVRIAEHQCAEHGLRMADGTRDAVLRHFQAVRRDETFGNGREARKVFEAAYERQSQRLAEAAEPATAEELTLLLPEDLEVETGLAARFGEARDGGQVTAVLDRLAAMVGLASVKREIGDLLDLVASARRRREAGLEADPVIGHLIFAGPPGTGKTTVARLYGELLSALGVLAQGQVIEATRGDLVGKYIGHTARNTAEVFERARGGVLFIDEAYALARESSATGDFGREAIDTLVKLMDDHRDEVIVIAAGYPDEMRGFLSANPGLASRFGRTLAFEPYEPAELAEIFVAAAGKADYRVPADVRERLAAHFDAERDRYRDGNGREVGKRLRAAITAHARRTERLAAAGETLTAEDLSTLRPEDMEER